MKRLQVVAAVSWTEFLEALPRFIDGTDANGFAPADVNRLRSAADALAIKLGLPKTAPVSLDQIKALLAVADAAENVVEDATAADEGTLPPHPQYLVGGEEIKELGEAVSDLRAVRDAEGEGGTGS